ncbi:hypothetical protein KBY96_01780 [Cyanobium sp. ATX 6A2]|uniref:hypothetical protein n=1 Tax=Cyanobium sp. ATX 6A2 TaxID=2823700 RepID=UPI0020CC167E|nr:hypothetical protein [Cyanobium sp. ATX 6A2]MCP9886668.1 hypothetical protein [Cyanobium sp. ATX 6A2]
MDDDYQDDDYKDDDYTSTPPPAGTTSSGSDDDDDDDDDYRGSGSDDDDDDYIGGPSGAGSRDDDDDDDDDYRGSGSDDDDYRGGTSSLGLVDDDYARRLFRDDDYITGQRIRKRDLKDDDYSFLPSSTDRLFEGSRRRDTLMGSGSGVEAFLGRRGADNFLLGNRRRDFYADDKRQGSRSSYGVINDFSFREDDTIFLHGRRKNYNLSRVRLDGIRGVGIFLEGGKRDTLIGVIQGQAPKAFNLSDSSVFQFFGG